ncbi:MAG: YcxB family protein [Clostridia bacterium]|nr:YcxB family protein [Clostridia bacterium]
MQILFKNKTILSSSNYIHLVQFHQKKNNWKYWLYTAFLSFLFLICIAFQFISCNYFIAFILLACFLGFLGYRFIEPYHKTKKELQSKKIQNNLVNYYFFYENYFKIKNSIGNSKLKYYKLYKVYENENYFYLYLNKDNCLIIEKTGFMIGNADSFRNFIKSKVRFKFKGN